LQLLSAIQQNTYLHTYLPTNQAIYLSSHLPIHLHFNEYQYSPSESGVTGPPHYCATLCYCSTWRRFGV